MLLQKTIFQIDFLYEKELQRTIQLEFRVEKLIKRKGNK